MPTRSQVRRPPPVDRRFQKRPVTSIRCRDSLVASMTICLAAACPMIGRIVTVSDMRLSRPTGTGSTSISRSPVTKFRWLTEDRRWGCLFAGPAARFLSLHARIFDILRSASGPVGVAEVKASTERAYLDEMAHARIKTTGVQLLLFGFDHFTPHVLTSWFDGSVEHAMLGFAAVGSGWSFATNWLDEIKGFRLGPDVGEIIYRLCEAKFAAELDSAVGGETFALSFDHNGASTQLNDDELSSAKKLWKKRRNTPPSPSVLIKLRGGTAYNRHGNASFILVFGAAFNAHSDALLRHSALKVALTDLYMRHGIPDDQYRAIDNLHKKATELMNWLGSAIGSWGKLDIKQAKVDVTIARLNDVLDRLQRILYSYTKKP